MGTHREEEIIALLEQQRPRSRGEERLGPLSDLREAGLDSLAMVRFWMSFEEAFNVRLETLAIEFGALRTVGDVLEQTRDPSAGGE